MNDHYKTLNISPTASESEIKKQYRKLSLQYHPDKNGGDDSKFKDINEAFETIGDPQKREEYDFQKQFNLNSAPPGLDGLLNLFMNPGGRNSRRGRSANPFMEHMTSGGGGGGGGGGFPGAKIHFFSGNMNDDFPNFMNGESNTPEPIEMKITISMKQSYYGCNVPVEIKRTVQTSHNKQIEKETLYIDIPAGIDNNEKIVLKEKGNIVNQVSSDIKIFISIHNDTQFIRKGLDLIYEKTISFKESICGFSFQIKYIDDREFKLNSKPGDIVLHTQEKTIPNLGIKRNDQIGNLIILFKIIPPETLSEEQISVIQKTL